MARVPLSISPLGRVAGAETHCQPEVDRAEADEFAAVEGAEGDPQSQLHAAVAK